jgi:hypothetical protein
MPVTFVAAYALKLATLLFMRPGELRHAEWTEFDLGSVPVQNATAPQTVVENSGTAY